MTQYMSSLRVNCNLEIVNVCSTVIKVILSNDTQNDSDQRSEISKKNFTFVA